MLHAEDSCRAAETGTAGQGAAVLLESGSGFGPWPCFGETVMMASLSASERSISQVCHPGLPLMIPNSSGSCLFDKSDF